MNEIDSRLIAEAFESAKRDWLTENEIYVVERRWLDDEKWAQIAREINRSVDRARQIGFSGLSRIHQRANTILNRERLELLGKTGNSAKHCA